MIRYFALVISVFFALGGFGLLAQQQSTVPAQPPTAGTSPVSTDQDKPPLTEEQRRQQQLRDLDPKAGPQSDGAQPGTRLPSPPPLPGSVAAGAQPAGKPGDRGPQVVTDDPASGGSGEYAGPAVLSRSYTLNSGALSRSIHWTPTISGSALYNTGLTGQSVQTGGTLSDQSSVGVRIGWGLVGSHLWKHDSVNVDYRGDANHYADSSGYNGTNHQLSLGYSHAFSRHLFLNVTELAGSFTQSYTLSNPALGIENSVANTNLASSPVVQILDNGFKQSSTSASLTWQKTARLSFSLGGGYFRVARTGDSLLGNTGYTSNADVNYRYTRKTTVGAYYSYSNYVYSGRVQISTSHTVGLIYSYAFSRSLELRLRLGGSQTESEGLTTVKFDPLLAALLGQSTGILESYSKRKVSDISAEIAKDFGRRKTARVSYARGISPGNGLQLTSIQEAITAGFTTAFSRTNSIDIGGGRTTLSSAAQNIGVYASNYISAGFVHRYARGIANDFRIYYRTFDITNSQVTHPQLSLSAGFSWSPGENPIHF